MLESVGVSIKSAGSNGRGWRAGEYVSLVRERASNELSRAGVAVCD